MLSIEIWLWHQLKPHFEFWRQFKLENPISDNGSGFSAKNYPRVQIFSSLGAFHGETQKMALFCQKMGIKIQKIFKTHICKKQKCLKLPRNVIEMQKTAPWYVRNP